MPAASTSAHEEPAKTIHLLVSRSAEKRRVASWVLSPISARKTVTKTAEKVFHIGGASLPAISAPPPRLAPPLTACGTVRMVSAPRARSSVVEQLAFNQ